MRRKHRRLQRRAPWIDPRPRILILCEGKATEPQYLRAFINDVKAAPVIVELDQGAGDPKYLVERAVQRRREAVRAARLERDRHLLFDEVWCVMDVDTHPRLADARQQARDQGISLAISNPCFELWILLHFRDHSAYLDARQAHAAVRHFVPKYAKRPPYEQMRGTYQDAVRRAQELERRHHENGSPEANPSSGVYRLTERILTLSAGAQLKKRSDP